jgi:hypothetical protein
VYHTAGSPPGRSFVELCRCFAGRKWPSVTVGRLRKPACRAQWPQAASVDLDALVDALVRLAIIDATAPGDRPARTAEAITGLLTPSVELMLAAAPRN